MKKAQPLTKLSDYLGRHERKSLFSCSLVFAAGLIIAFLGVKQLLSAFSIWFSGEVLVGESFNLMFANVIIAVLSTMLSLPLFLVSYFLIESHSLGIKLSFAAAAIIFTLAILGNLNLILGLVTGVLCTVAAIMKIAEQKWGIARKSDSPVVTENVVRFGLRLSGFATVALLFGMFVYIAARGIGYVNWSFLTDKWNINQAKDAIGTGVGSIGGISDFIIGSLLLVSLCEAIAIPLGLGAAIFLSEYATENKITNTIRFFIETLAGAPSIVIGIVGYLFFATLLGWQYSLLGGAISLAFMILPWNIRVAEEAMRAVPESYREGAYAIGATKWQTIKHMVLYAGSPGIITGIILGLGAALGETAVVLLTAGSEGVGAMPRNLTLTNAQIPTLPVWIYTAFSYLIFGGSTIDPSRKNIVVWEAQNVCLAGALVLIVIFLAICLIALAARNYMSKKIAGR